MERSPEVSNTTRVQAFILLGLSTRPDLRGVLFVVFLTLYLLTLLENSLIIYLICSHSELHKPMYFFLGNLSCLEMCYVSVTVPSLLVGLWAGPFHVPFTACMTQLFFFMSLLGTKCTLLASMAYDRYVAICRPLHYPLLLRPRVCLGLALASWLGGLVVSISKTACIATLTYCSPNILNHFFCDLSPLLNLSCTHVGLTELVDFISAIVIFCGTLLVALGSYVAIGRAVLCMPSAAARRKAFSTCASHLLVVGIFYSAALFIYCRPSRIESTDLHKVLSLVYTVATPLCSPIIYSLRNREVRAVLRRALLRPRVSAAQAGVPASFRGHAHRQTGTLVKAGQIAHGASKCFVAQVGARPPRHWRKLLCGPLFSLPLFSPLPQAWSRSPPVTPVVALWSSHVVRTWWVHGILRSLCGHCLVVFLNPPVVSSSGVQLWSLSHGPPESPCGHSPFLVC